MNLSMISYAPVFTVVSELRGRGVRRRSIDPRARDAYALALAGYLDGQGPLKTREIVRTDRSWDTLEDVTVELEQQIAVL